MLSGWETLPSSLSTYSADIDKLFWDVTWLMGFSWVVSSIVMIYLFVAFKKKEGGKAAYLPGESGKQLLLIYAPLALFVCFDMYIDVSTAAVWKTVKTELPPAEVKVRAIAQQWAWTFEHEGADGKLGTPDDVVTVNEMHIPAGKTIHVEMESSDVLHSFSIPVFRIKQDVIPGRIITSWFTSHDFATVKAEKEAMWARYNAAQGQGGNIVLAPHEDTEGTASFDLQCTEMCGVGHGIMSAKVVVHSDASYNTFSGVMEEPMEEAPADDAASEPMMEEAMAPAEG